MGKMMEAAEMAGKRKQGILWFSALHNEWLFFWYLNF
jgi:hypothetical protein